MKYTFKHNSWFGRDPVTVEIPDDWELTECRMPCDDMPELTKEQLKERIDRPYHTKTIRELAAGKQDVCIIFDDMSRGTPCEEIAEIILEELHEAGVPKEHIRFICALGSHGTCTREDFVKKLGKRIVKEYAVFNHNPFQCCDHIGKTSGGVELYYNSEVMRCDLKIGIGSISPHPVNGFGGGVKLMMIGCAGIDTIEQLHACSLQCVIKKKLAFADCLGTLELDGMRREMEEGSRMVGFDFKIDALLNDDCRIVECTAGDPVEEYYKGVEISSRIHFSNTAPSGLDVVIVNANVKANEAAIGFMVANSILKKSGGALVMVDHIPTGQVVHQLAGASGYYCGGREFRGHNERLPNVDKVILYSPNPDMQSAMAFGNYKRIRFAETWNEVMGLLSEYGPGTRAGVISDGTIIAFHR